MVSHLHGEMAVQSPHLSSKRDPFPEYHRARLTVQMLFYVLINFFQGYVCFCLWRSATAGPSPARY